MDENTISRQVIGAAVEVHRTRGGPGLLESVYEEALVWDLPQPGLTVERQKFLPIVYRGRPLTAPLRLSGLKLALALNFGEKLVRNGIHRVVNKL